MKPTIFLLSTAWILSACAFSAPPTFGRGIASVVSPDSAEPIVEENEGLNATNFGAMITDALRKMESCKVNKKQTFMISQFLNQTSSDLPMDILFREALDKFHIAGYEVTDKSARPEIHEEAIWEKDGGYTKTEDQIQKGRAVGLGGGYLVRIALNSRAQQTEDNKFVRYYLSIQLTEAESARVSCVGSSTLNKTYERTKYSY